MNSLKGLSKHFFRVAAVVTAILSLNISPASSYSSGPPDGKAGDPPEYADCTQCHSTYPVNSGIGTLQFLNLPPEYHPDSVYTFTISLENPGQRIWGFEMTPLLEDESRGGWLTPLDANVQVSSPGNPDRDYAKHTTTGNFAGAASASWQVQWTAPPASSGSVEFYLAGNAGNGDGSFNGDYIYTVDNVIPEAILGVSDPILSLPQTQTLLDAYPNPFNPTITVDLQGAPGETIQLQVLNLQGQLLNHHQLEFNTGGVTSIHMNLTDQPSGLYIVRALYPGGSVTKRITKLK